MGKLWLNFDIVSRWIKINVDSIDRKLLKYGYACKTNKQKANTSVLFTFESRSGYQSSSVTHASISRLCCRVIFLWHPLWRRRHFKTWLTLALATPCDEKSLWILLDSLHSSQIVAAQNHSHSNCCRFLSLSWSGIFNELWLFIFSNRLCYSGEKAKKNIPVDTLSVCVDGYVFCLKIYSWLPK